MYERDSRDQQVLCDGRTEIASQTVLYVKEIDELKRVAPDMLEEWSRTKKAPRHAAWLHELEFTGSK